MGDKTFILLICIVCFITGILISPFILPITNVAFYSELRKRALSSSEFICNEAKQSKFLYEQYKKEGN